MKKIYILTAVLALLTLSLNAQTQNTKKWVRDVAPTEKVDTPFGKAIKSSNSTGLRAPNRETQTSSLVFTSACGGSGTADDGAAWTVTSDASESQYDSTKGIHYGTANASVSYIQLSTSSITGTIKSVVVNASTASGATGYVSVTVGGNTFGETQQTLSTTATDYTFTGSASGEIVVRVFKDASATKALYCKSITVTYETGSGGGGETSETDLTVCDGTATNNYLPIYAYYYDNYQKNQMIYPENLISDLVGTEITSMTFYATADFTSWSGGSVTARLATTTDQSSYSTKARLQPADMAVVASGFDVPSSGNTWTITFDTPFTYNGGNLVVDLEETSISSNWSASGFGFYGVTQSGGGFNSYSSSYDSTFTSVYSSGSVQNFLPKVKFTYEPSGPQHDLGIALSTPASVGAGGTATLTATVTNNGGYDENGYTVTFYADGAVISTQTGTSLAIGDTQTFTYEYATTSAQAGTTVNFTATVACTSDAVASNNNATASMSILNLPPPVNVAATADGTTATVTWNEPIVDPISVTEDFEDTTKFPSFSLGGITATQHYGSVGGWTLYDSTGASVWGSENDDFENEGEPQAWMVFNATSVGVAAYSGVQYMESICPLTSAAAPADSWLISPKLSGYAQTITFYERALSSSYGNETYEVWASSTDNDPASFTFVESYTDNTLTWTQRSASLPEGTRYFAIRHTSNDIFGICVDDVTYEVPGEPQPVSYNIYLDGVLVGNVDANTFSYDFSNISQGNHECAVSAVYDAGESALVPAQFSTLPKTATPTINVVTNADGSKTISATGDGTVHLYIDGVEQSNPYTIMPSLDGDITVTVTATAQEEGKLVSETATQTVTVAEAGRSPMPTISWTDNGDGTYTITVVGTGEVNVYINDAEHGGTEGDPVATGQGRVSITVEQHSQAMTITVQATNQEDGLAVSRTAEETYTIPAMSLDGFTPLDPQPAGTSAPIDLSNLMFVDRFSKVIPATNDHPYLYSYYLQESQVRQRTSNSVEVPVKHTGSDGLGFYTINQIDNDVNIGINHDEGLTMGVRNAAMELPLEADPGIYYYTESRGTAEHPNVADLMWLGRFQHTTDGNYSEMLEGSYDHGEVYPGGQHHIHLDTDIVTGDYNNYLTYVPIVWTMGFDRVNYETDHTHNSYGAPRWKTGVAEVRIENLNAERQNGYMGSTNWQEDGEGVSIYMLTLDAIGTMPTVNTMPYEPYMFRVFVESKNGKLRGYTRVGDGEYGDGTHYEGDGTGPLTGPVCLWSEYVNGSDRISVNGYDYTFHKEKEPEYDPEHPDHWIAPEEANIMFAAMDVLETEGEGELKHIKTDELNVFVRFYYIVEGSAEGHVVGTRAEGDPAGYGAESPGTAPNPATSVREINFHGEVVSTTYVNAQGMTSETPFDGVNIVVTRYSDGTTTTTKVTRRR